MSNDYSTEADYYKELEHDHYCPACGYECDPDGHCDNCAELTWNT
jgi:hypothetical protein